MSRRRDAAFLRAVLRSGIADAPQPGARVRALAMLRDEASGASWAARAVAGAILAALVVATTGSGLLESPWLQGQPAQSAPSSMDHGCSRGVEGPSQPCGDTAVSTGSSSGGATGCSGSGARGESGSSSG